MNQNNILSHEAFKNINPKKLRILTEMLNEMGTKSAEQKLQILFTYGLKMKQMGLDFTPTESRILMESMKQNLTPTEQNKLDMMEKMMSLMNKK